MPASGPTKLKHGTSRVNLVSLKIRKKVHEEMVAQVADRSKGDKEACLMVGIEQDSRGKTKGKIMDDIAAVLNDDQLFEELAGSNKTVTGPYISQIISKEMESFSVVVKEAPFATPDHDSEEMTRLGSYLYKEYTALCLAKSRLEAERQQKAKATAEETELQQRNDQEARERALENASTSRITGQPEPEGAGGGGEQTGAAAQAQTTTPPRKKHRGQGRATKGNSPPPAEDPADGFLAGLGAAAKREVAASERQLAMDQLRLVRELGDFVGEEDKQAMIRSAISILKQKN